MIVTTLSAGNWSTPEYLPGPSGIVESFLDMATPGQQRLINAIVTMPIKEMCAKLRA